MIDIADIEPAISEAGERRAHGSIITLGIGLTECLRTANYGEALPLAIAARKLAAYESPSFAAGMDAVLGVIYADLPAGDRGDNLRRAIERFEAALRVYTEHDHPRQWAMTQTNLGAAYADLSAGDRGDNLRRAIECFEAALRVYTESDLPRDWAMTQRNLGTAYADLPTGNLSGNLLRTIECFKAALRVYTESDFTREWAITQANLAAAYYRLPTGDRGDIECSEEAARGFAAADMETAAQVARAMAEALGRQK